MRRLALWLRLAAPVPAAAPARAQILVSGKVEVAGGAPLAGASVELLPLRDAYQAGLNEPVMPVRRHG